MAKAGKAVALEAVAQVEYDGVDLDLYEIEYEGAKRKSADRMHPTLNADGTNEFVVPVGDGRHIFVRVYGEREGGPVGTGKLVFGLVEAQPKPAPKGLKIDPAKAAKLTKAQLLELLMAD